MTEFRAPRLTVLALHWLREKYPDAMLTTELAVAKYGDASLDVAAVTETEIFGVEVKGDGDNSTRLERQGWVYSRTASQMWLLPSPTMEKSAKKHRPRGWGMLLVNGAGLKQTLGVYDPPLPNAAAALLNILWKDELIDFAKVQGFPASRKSSCDKIASHAAEQSSLSVIRPYVCQALRRRDWKNPPYPKTVYHPGDALPEMSVCGNTGGTDD